MALRRMVAAFAVPALVLLACGDDDDAGAGGSGDDPSIVVTTNILGDVVSELVGDLADVTTVMPVGANPHDFQASAQQVAAINRADALVVNGEGFEEGLEDTIDAATGDGVPTHEAISAVSTIELGDHAEEGDRAEEDHAEEGDHAEEDEHGHGNVDPHFFTDPTRMVDAVEGIADFLAGEVPELDTDEFRRNVDDYVAQLEELDAEVEATLEPISDERRVLVTNHEVFGYFADRYGFEIVGTVIPGGSTNDGASAGGVAELARIIQAEGVPAIFAETSSPARLAETLASEVGGEIEIVELYTESLGEEGSEASTYLDMVRVDADRIAAALA